MTTAWKTLVVSIAVYLVLLTYCFMDMAGYLQWLHFNDGPQFRSLTATTPGRSTALTLGIGAGLLIATNLLVAFRSSSSRRDLAEPAARSDGRGPRA